jgi:hypothetical protein
MVTCRMILHHADGRIEETDVRGDGVILPGSLWQLPASADHWWKVVGVRWPADGGTGVAELEPSVAPPPLLKR